MNDQPTQSPFTTSTLETNGGQPSESTPVEPASSAASAQSAALIASLLPMAIISGGIFVCAILWFISNGNTIMRAAGVIVLLSDIGVALFLRQRLMKRGLASLIAPGATKAVSDSAVQSAMDAARAAGGTQTVLLDADGKIVGQWDGDKTSAADLDQMAQRLKDSPNS